MKPIQNRTHFMLFTVVQMCDMHGVEMSMALRKRIGLDAYIAASSQDIPFMRERGCPWKYPACWVYPFVVKYDWVGACEKVLMHDPQSSGSAEEVPDVTDNLALLR